VLQFLDHQFVLPEQFIGNQHAIFLHDKMYIYLGHNILLRAGFNVELMSEVSLHAAMSAIKTTAANGHCH
jgi:hypothetical protein